MPYIFNSILLLAAGVTSHPIDLSHEEAQRTYEIAGAIMKFVHEILSCVGLEHNMQAVNITYIVLVALLAFGSGLIIQKLVMLGVEAISKRMDSQWFRLLRNNNFFAKICRIIPPVVFLILIEFTMAAYVGIGKILTHVTIIYMVYVVTRAVTAASTACWQHFDAKDNRKQLPLKGILQLINGIVWIVAVIIVVAYLIDKSPAKLLTGLGAFAAVLMLVFKDSILGVVAGVQLSENDSLHVGDWIAVKGTDANGIVEEVSLTMVKIRNFDKTVVSLPPYTLVSGSFTNYRAMQVTDTRRIQRCIYIDVDSILTPDAEMLAEISKLPGMAEYIAAKQIQVKDGKVDNRPSDKLVAGSIETNLGLFRAYVQMYLDSNQDIDHTSDCFVCTKEQTATGVPLQIYCFTNTSKWIPYEVIQAYIFEHLALVLPKFKLYLYEACSGRDTIVDGYLSAGHPADNIFGMPRPFFTDANQKPNLPPPSTPAK